MILQRLSLLLPALALVTLLGCASDSSEFQPDPNRGPLGKVDHISETCVDSYLIPLLEKLVIGAVVLIDLGPD